MQDRLINIFADVLGLSVDELSDDSSPETVKQWDSLAAMNLVNAIEDTFSVQLKTREIMKMRTIGITREVLVSKGVNLD